jgi:NTP pyrophosphatase (non-canonical NTP hydrolase)
MESNLGASDFMLFITEFGMMQTEVHKTAIEKGWWKKDRDFLHLMALAHSEISEAVEAWREHRTDDAIVEELADTVIRLMDVAEHFEMNLADAIVKKHFINLKRPYRHGDKKA